MNDIVTLTSEQQDALDLFLTGQSLAIEAGAGTGKTSTLLALSHATTLPCQYVAFNKAIVQDGGKKFPSHVTCSTAHSLAMRAVGINFLPRLQNSQRMKSIEIAKVLGLNPIAVTNYAGERKVLGAGFLAGQVMEGVRRFCQSADAAPTARHVPFIENLDAPPSPLRPNSYAVNNEVSAALVPYMKKVWDDSMKYQGSLPYKHDYYLKLWQLTEPKIAAPIIFFDECQDANPVMLDIIMQQTGSQVVWVGDSNQQIYEFTGAVNALEKIAADERTYLTQSFRFGPSVAEVANDVLGRLDTKLRLVGFDEIDSEVTEIETPDAILTRTNAAAVRAVLDAQKDGVKAHLVGGGGETTRFLKAAKRLIEGQRVEHPDLACFETWQEVLDYVDEDEQGGELKLLVNLIEEFDIDPILEALEATAQERHAQLVISTAHKSKGREWNRVKLSGDFPSDEKKITDAELRLLYVAVTRAKIQLDISLVGVLGGEAPEDAKVERREREIVKASEHVGQEGDKIELDATVEACRPFDGKFGRAYVTILRDADNNAYKWVSKDQFFEGDRITAKFRVKEHDEFNGTKQTVIFHPSSMKVSSAATA